MASKRPRQGSNFILFRRHKLGTGQDLGSTLVFYIFADRNRRSNHMEERNGSDSLVVHPKLSPLYPSPGKLVQRQANVNSLLRIRMIRGMLEGRVPWSGVIGVGSAETPRCLAAQAIREPHQPLRVFPKQIRREKQCNANLAAIPKRTSGDGL